MDESEVEKKLEMLEHRTESFEGKLDELKMELRTAAIFLVVLTIALKIVSVFISLISAAVITSIFMVINASRLKKYGTF